jgi:hypothetical protein
LIVEPQRNRPSVLYREFEVDVPRPLPSSATWVPYEGRFEGGEGERLRGRGEEGGGAVRKL